MHASTGDELESLIDEEVVQKIMLKNLRQNTEEISMHMAALACMVEGHGYGNFAMEEAKVEKTCWHGTSPGMGGGLIRCCCGACVARRRVRRSKGRRRLPRRPAGTTLLIPTRSQP